MDPREKLNFCLRYEDDVRRAINDKKQDSGYPKGGGGGSRISDPTATQAIKNLSTIGTVEVEYGPRINGKGEFYMLHNAEEWLDVVQSVWNHYRGKKQGRLLELRYKQGCYEINEELVKKIGYSRSYIFRMMKDIFKYGTDLAKGLGIDQEPTPRLLEIMKKIGDAQK